MTCFSYLLFLAWSNFVLVFLSVDSSDCRLLFLLPLSIDCFSKNPATELLSRSMVLFRFCRSTDTLPLSFSSFLANYGPSLCSSVSRITLLMRLSSFFSCFCVFTCSLLIRVCIALLLGWRLATRFWSKMRLALFICVFFCTALWSAIRLLTFLGWFTLILMESSCLLT